MAQNSTTIVDLQDNILSNELILNQIFTHLSHADVKSISLTNKILWHHGRRILRKRGSMLTMGFYNGDSDSVCPSLQMVDDLIKDSIDISFQGFRFSIWLVGSICECGPQCQASENPNLPYLYPHLREAKCLWKNVVYQMQGWILDCPGLKFIQSQIVQNAHVVETLKLGCNQFNAHPKIPDRFKTFWNYLGIAPSEILQQQFPPAFTNLKEYSDYSTTKANSTPLKALIDVAPNVQTIYPMNSFNPTWVVNSSGIPLNKLGTIADIELCTTEDLDNFKNHDFRPRILELLNTFLENLTQVSSFNSFLESKPAGQLCTCLTKLCGNFANIAFISVAVAQGKIQPFRNLKHMTLTDDEELLEDIQDTGIRFINFDSAFPRLSLLDLEIAKPSSNSLLISPIPPMPLCVNFDESNHQSTSVTTLNIRYCYGKNLNLNHSILLENFARFFPNVQKLELISERGSSGQNWYRWCVGLLRVTGDTERNTCGDRNGFFHLKILEFGCVAADELCNLSIPDLFGVSELYLNEFHDQDKTTWQNLHIFPLNFSPFDPRKKQFLVVPINEYEERKLDGSTERCFVKTLDEVRKFLPIPVVKLLSVKFPRFKLMLRTSSKNAMTLFEALQQHLQHYAHVKVVEMKVPWSKCVMITFLWDCPGRNTKILHV